MRAAISSRPIMMAASTRQSVPSPYLLIRIETDGGLIHDEQGRPVQRALGDFETLQHAAGIVLRKPVRRIRKAGHRRRLLDPLGTLVARSEIKAGRKKFS